MLGTGKLVDDEKAVADVEADVAAVVGVEEEVTHSAFPAAVEVNADKLAVGIENGTAAIAASGVVGGYEGDRHLALGVGITTIVVVVVELFEARLDNVVVDVGVLLLHDAFKGAVRRVVDGILGTEALHMAIRHTEGEVGVGEEITVGELLHHAADIGTHEAVDLAPVDVVVGLLVGGVGIAIGDAEKVYSGVVEDFLPVLSLVGFEEFVVFGVVVEHGLVVDVFEHALHPSLVLAFLVEVGRVAGTPHVEERLDKDGAINWRVEFEIFEVFLVGSYELVALDTGQTVVVDSLTSHAPELVGAVHEVGSHDSFVEVGPLQLNGAEAIVGTTHVAEDILVLGTLVGPCLEGSLLIFLLLHTFETQDAEGFALPLLPAVGNGSNLGGIFETLGGRLVHGSVVVAQTDVAQGYADGVFLQSLKVDLVVGDIALGGAGIAEDEGEVALVDPLEGDVEMFEGLVGDVGLGVVGGLAILAHIDAEHGEIARVARPHPVVGVAAELTNVAWGSTHKAHIGEDLVDVHEILIAIVEGLDDGFVVCAGNSLDREDGNILLNNALALCLGSFVINAFEDTIGDILHAHKTGCRKTLAGNLLVTFHGPEAVGEVVVLHSAVTGNVVVAAVVVGEEKALVGDKLAGATLVEEDDGIFETGVVDVVDVFGSDVHASLLHGSLVFAKEHGNPHTLVSKSGRHQKDCQCENGKDFFHRILCY